MNARHIGPAHVNNALRANGWQNMDSQEHRVFFARPALALGGNVKGEEVPSDFAECRHCARGPAIGDRVGTLLDGPENDLGL